jgi:PBP1b-binding outer membrane lipoprotein LpoB
MKKTLLSLLFVAFFLTSCTEQERAKHLGDNITVEVDPGYKLIEATWKENNLWVLIEPMEEGYQPKTKIFKESSSYGILEGSITFKESKK